MARSAVSILVSSYCPFGLGAVLLLAPNVPLSLFCLQPAEDVRIRVVGMLVLLLGYDYWQAAHHELTVFICASVLRRCAVLVTFISCVATDLAPLVLVLFGVVDAASVVSTAGSLQAS